MKIAKRSAVFFVTLISGFTVAIAETTLSFPEERIGLPSTSLSAFARDNLPPIFKSETGASTWAEVPRPPTWSEDKFVVKPDERVDYKLLIKQPDASVNYRLIVKNPATEHKK